MQTLTSIFQKKTQRAQFSKTGRDTKGDTGQTVIIDMQGKLLAESF